MQSEPAVPTTGAMPGEKDLTDLFESADLGVHFTDASGVIIWANRADCACLGYETDEYVGRHISEFHADPGAANEMLARLVAGERVTQYPARLVCKDGSIRHVEITGSARFLERGDRREFVHTRCFTQDVTERRRLEQARSMLVRAGQSLSQSLDIDETLAVLSKLTVPHFADWYAVYLVDEAGDVRPVHISHVDPTRTQLAWSVVERWPDSADSNSAPAAAISTGQSYLVPHVTDELLARVSRGPEHLKLLELAGINSVMLVPLKLPTETIGSMMFIAAESNRVYREDDLALAEALANRAALAIANARLHRQVSEARDAAQQSAERLAILLKASEAIAHSLQPDEALSQLARFATPVLADYCVTYRLDPDGRIERVGLAHADPAKQPLVEALVQAGPPTLADAHGVGAVLRTGVARLTRDISGALTDSTAQNDEHAAALRELEPRSSILVPLEARGRTLGGAAFVATDLSNRRYSEADLALAEELAKRVALLVDNARLYEEGRAANRAMEDMLSIVAHDLRNPLNTVVTSSSLLPLDLPRDQHETAIASIRRAVEQMGRLLDDLFDIKRIGQRRLSVVPETVDLCTLATDALGMHAPIARSRNIRLEGGAAPAPVLVQADPGRLLQAVCNLIDNALKFTPPGGEVHLEVRRSPGAAELCVVDTGPGIPNDQLLRVFDRFWRADRNDGTGLGLGLSIAKGIAEAHGGRIDVSSAPGKGARFTLVLPCSA